MQTGIAVGVAADFVAAGRTNVLNIHLHRLFPPEFVDLGNEGYIHQIPHFDGGGFGGDGD